VINNPLIYTDSTGNMHGMGGKSGSAGGGAYTVPKWIFKDFKIVKLKAQQLNLIM
jgi:hypothetical protein